MACLCCVTDEKTEQVTISTVDKPKTETPWQKDKEEEPPLAELPMNAEPPVVEVTPPKEEVKKEVVKEEIEEEPTTGSEFTIKIQKDGKLGISLETLVAGYCVVRSVEPTSVMKGVQPFDRLVKVQGSFKKAAQLAKALGDAKGEVEVTFERPLIKEITLQKNGKKAGFRVDQDLQSCGLMIKALVDGGAASDMPADTFRPMDRLMAVDGKEGSSAELLKMLGANDSPVLKVCRYTKSYELP